LVFLWPLLASLFNELYSLRLRQCVHYIGSLTIWAVGIMQDVGIDVLFTNGHHRKIAIIDDILWEGSLNILSQNNSCEIMRRTKSKEVVNEIISFTGLRKWCK